MIAAVRREWFLVALVVVLAIGMPVGRFLGPDGVPELGLLPAVSTAVVLFLMAFSLDASRLAAAVTRPLPVLIAVGVNAVWMPLAAWPLATLIARDDLRVGLMIAASVPCTLAAASVWTRRAGGDDAVSLLTTLATNGACFVVAPFWLATTCGLAVEIDAAALATRLFCTAVVPMGLGQLVRAIPSAGRVARARKPFWSQLALVTILTVIAYSAVKAGSYLSSLDALPDGGSVAVTLAAGAGGHVVAFGLAWRLAGEATRPRRIAVAFAGSQKTLPVGILLATSPEVIGSDPSGLPLVAFPMLFVHASQLAIDTVIASRLAKGGGPDSDAA
ncbi:MAG: bile acid:sodium symporter [Planctomycetota bacterium]